MSISIVKHFNRNFSKFENGPKICGFGGLEGENMKDER